MMKKDLITELNRNELLDLYEKMVRIRVFEEKIEELGGKGHIFGPAIPCSGEEAVHVGVCANLRQDDKVVASHRPHGEFIAKGSDPRRMMAESMGKKTGFCKGKGGSINMADFSTGVLGATAVLGSQIPYATGVALASKLENKDQVTICFFGDGASNEGTFHESLNLASVFNLPIVYICLNNGYATSLPVEEGIAITNISDRASSYGMAGETVDGNDVLAVYEAARQAVIRARKKEGPTLLECKAHCWHSLSREAVSYFTRDDDYRTKFAPKKGAPIPEEWKARDPIPNFKSRLLSNEITTERETEEITDRIKAEIEEAVNFAMESPYPMPEEAMEDIFCPAR
jgi:acetoin:2,6-dichlorophenolindophenol oxidoreductase subunit alpha